MVVGENINIDPNTNVISASSELDVHGVYASQIYYEAGKAHLFKPAWEHSLEVDAGEISASSTAADQRGKAQYPDGEVEGVIIPNSVTSIGQSAFQGWTSNNQPLVIPNSVTSMAGFAFNNWGQVPYLEMQSITPPTLAGSNAFAGQNDAPIYVPDESVNDYKTATNWSDLSDRIKSINEL